MKYYAGIGSRETPAAVLELMTAIAEDLQLQGYRLRSGHAKGADRAFEGGAQQRKEIFIAQDATRPAVKLASQHHPAWEKCDSYARKLHGRNAMIVLGRRLDTPVEFIVCWTKGGRVIGGTGLALRIAEARRIPVYNLAKKGEYDRLVIERIAF